MAQVQDTLSITEKQAQLLLQLHQERKAIQAAFEVAMWAVVAGHPGLPDDLSIGNISDSPPSIQVTYLIEDEGEEGEDEPTGPELHD